MQGGGAGWSRARVAQAAAWLGLSALGYVALATSSGLPAADAEPDCSVRLAAELAPLDALLPPRAVVELAGPLRDGDCDPGMVAHRVLAPRFVMHEARMPLGRWERGGPVLLAERPELVILLGDRGHEWLRENPDADVLARVSPRIALARRR